MIDAVVIWAVSYSGATWVCFVLGSRPEALAIGNAERGCDFLRDTPGRACQIHYEQCPLWPAFAEAWDRDAPFLEQVARFSGKRCLVIRNPRAATVKGELSSPGVRARHVVITRDIRALAASYLRKNPGLDVFEAADKWLTSAATRMRTFADRPGAVVVSHGQACVDPDYLSRKLTEATGAAYGPREARFWEHEHHIMTGNGATMRTVADYQQGLKHGEEFYNDYLKQLRESPEPVFVDERWQQELSRFDRFVLDQLLGETQDALGYPRDRFTRDEERDFGPRMAEALGSRR